MVTTSRATFWRSVLAIAWLACGVSTARGQGGETLTPLQIEKDPIAWMGGKNVIAVARVGADGAEFRSGPDPNYRVVRRAEAGTLVLVVDYHPNHYCEILVPTGYRAYVHNRFCQVGEDGLGRCHEERVNVRSLPSSQGDYPIGQIGPGDVLLVWGTVGTDQDWYEVTPPGRLTLYVEDTSLDLVGAMDEAISSEIAAARSELYDRFIASSEDAKAKASAAKEAEARIRAEYETILAAIDVQRARGTDANYESIANDLTRLGTETDDSDLLRDIEAQRELVASLSASVERESQLRAQQEADRQAAAKRAVVTTTNPTGTTPATATTPAATGSSGEWVGFLRSRPDSGGLAFSIEQGTRTVLTIDTSSTRYRWSDFVGLQVRVRGRVAQAGGVPVVDVTKLEIQR